MNLLPPAWRTAAIGCLSALLCISSHALTAEQAFAMAAADETEQRVTAINQAVLEPSADADSVQRLATYLAALANDEVRVAAGKAFIVAGDTTTDPATGVATKLPADAQDIVNNNYMRSVIDTAQAALTLGSSDVQTRRTAAQKLAAEPDTERLPLIEKALTSESDSEVKALLTRAKAASMLASDDTQQRLTAVAELAQQQTPDTQLLLNQRLADESDPAVQKAIQSALAKIADGLAWGERLGEIFSGISLGSVLLLAALGLAITYGLMGVINMAHGELIMIGAYATYMVQVLFQRYIPESAFGWYLAVAIPVSFCIAALVGAALERGVLRFCMAIHWRPCSPPLVSAWCCSKPCAAFLVPRTSVWRTLHG